MGSICCNEKSITINDKNGINRNIKGSENWSQSNIIINNNINGNINENNIFTTSNIARNNMNDNISDNNNNKIDNDNNNSNNKKNDENNIVNNNNKNDNNNNNQDYIKQIKVNPYGNELSIDKMKIITNQMEKKVCKIKCRNGSTGTGFFCKIPYPNFYNLLPVLITNNHVLNEEDLKINNIIVLSINNDQFTYKILIDNSRKIYTNENLFDITIIEIKENDGINLNYFLELDDEDEMNEGIKDVNKIYKDKNVYIIHYPGGDTVKCDQGIIQAIEENNYTILHKCNTDSGSSGCPILNLTNYKVIGFHKGASKTKLKSNFGTLIKEPLKIFNEKTIKKKKKKRMLMN